MRQQTKAVGIALEVGEVLPRVSLPHYRIIPLASIALGEVGSYGSLATMSEGWIAHIVRQTSR